jgi:hypothetical protein
MTTGRINQVAAFKAGQGRLHGRPFPVPPSVIERQAIDPRVDAWRVHNEGATLTSLGSRPLESSRGLPVKLPEHSLEQLLESDEAPDRSVGLPSREAPYEPTSAR